MHTKLYNGPQYKSHKALFRPKEQRMEKKNIDFPEIILGFEVYLSRDILDEPNLDGLLITGTNTMLVEMPLAKWNEDIFKRLEFLLYKGYDIIIAHPERYQEVCGKEEYDRLFSYGCVGQFNAASLIYPNTREFTFSMIKEGKIKLIGSDAHNLGTRANIMEIAADFIRKRLGDEVLDNMKDTAEHYLGRR